MLTETCMQRGESRAAVMVIQGLLSAQFSPAAAAAPSPPLATAIVSGVLAARGEGLGGGVGDVEPGVRHRGHAEIFAHPEHGRLGHAVERLPVRQPEA